MFPMCLGSILTPKVIHISWNNSLSHLIYSTIFHEVHKFNCQVCLTQFGNQSSKSFTEASQVNA